MIGHLLPDPAGNLDWQFAKSTRPGDKTPGLRTKHPAVDLCPDPRQLFTLQRTEIRTSRIDEVEDDDLAAGLIERDRTAIRVLGRELRRRLIYELDTSRRSSCRTAAARDCRVISLSLPVASPKQNRPTPLDRRSRGPAMCPIATRWRRPRQRRGSQAQSLFPDLAAWPTVRHRLKDRVAGYLA